MTVFTILGEEISANETKSAQQFLTEWMITTASERSDHGTSNKHCRLFAIQTLGYITDDNDQVNDKNLFQ